jgi:hypothetical protein
MDNRLSNHGTQRLKPLFNSELEDVAYAITACVTGKAKAGRHIHDGAEYVRITGLDVDVCILASDWRLLEPYVDADYFQSMIYPTPFSGAHGPLAPTDILSEGGRTRPLYDRVLMKLRELFTTDFPKSRGY